MGDRAGTSVGAWASISVGVGVEVRVGVGGRKRVNMGVACVIMGMRLCLQAMRACVRESGCESEREGKRNIRPARPWQCEAPSRQPCTR
eukprot:4416299-Pleurochrysis_carterae.AAC.2